MSAAKLDGTKHVNDEGSEVVISYMQSHHNPAVELFATSFMEEWMKSPEKARDPLLFAHLVILRHMYLYSQFQIS